MAKEIDLAGMELHSDPAMEKVIAAQAKTKDLERMNAALKKDRDMLLSEYKDVMSSRPVHKSPYRATKDHKVDITRLSAGDFHGMRNDKGAAAAFIKGCRDIMPEEIVLGGDFLECGGWLARHQPLGFVAYCDYSYQEDVNATNEFLDDLQITCPNATIYYLMGNHEDRVEKWIVDQVMGNGRDGEFLRSTIGPEAVLRLEDRGIQVIRRDEIYDDGYPRGWLKLGKMCFTHELAIGKNAASKAAEKAACNVRYFHSHREDTATRVYPGVGPIKAMSAGCLCEIQPMWRHSDPSGWSQGYAIDFVSKSGLFQSIHVPIWKGASLADAMIERFKA